MVAKTVLHLVKSNDGSGLKMAKTSSKTMITPVVTQIVTHCNT